MLRTDNNRRGAGSESCLVVLLARIVDPAGVSIRPSAVKAIECSIYKRDQFDPVKLSAIDGHCGVALDASDVIADTLQTGGSWTIDVGGYNFRHRIDLTEVAVYLCRRDQLEIHYVVTPTIGEKMIIRFQLRGCQR